MLHLTSLFQIAATCKKSPSDHINYLNRLNKNYSFVYDQRLDRYDFVFNDEEADDSEDNSMGYFGCFRDKNADRRYGGITKPVSSSAVNSSKDTKSSAFLSAMHSDADSTNEEIYNGYWGIFKDTHQLDTETQTHPAASASIEIPSLSNADGKFFSNEESEHIVNESSGESSLKSNSSLSCSFSEQCDASFVDGDICNNITSMSTSKLLYDYKVSKFRIKTGKSEKMKVFIQNLEDRVHGGSGSKGYTENKTNILK